MKILDRIFNRAVSQVPAAGASDAGAGVTMEQRIEAANKYRESLNPLRGLTLAKAVSVLENAMQGNYPELQWYYRFIERRDADLIALVERRTGALKQMDWHIKTLDENTAGERGIKYNKAQATAQADALRAAYNKIDNLYAAIYHLAMSSFREFSICQFHDATGKPALAGQATHIECLDQWTFSRDGMQGDFYWNPEGRMTRAKDLGAMNKVNPANCLIRTCERPLDEIAFFKFIRNALCDKDWDGFIEIFGIPGGVVIMPPNIPAGKEHEYRTAAEQVSAGAAGALPNGSTIDWPDGPRGSTPFQARMQYLTEKLILAGTGGLLTMLAQSGSGTLAGSAHMEAFRIVARGEARDISELFQTQFDKPLLAAQFAGQPVMAYFELAANETPDTAAIIKEIMDLSTAGFQIDPAQVQEKTGYRVTVKPAAAALPQAAPLQNRSQRTEDSPQSTVSTSAPSASSLQSTAATRSARLARLAAAQAKAVGPLKPFFARLENIINDDQASDEQMLAALEIALKDLPRLAAGMDSTEFARELEAAMAAAMIAGAQESKLATKSGQTSTARGQA